MFLIFSSRFGCRLEKLRKSLFVKVQKINGNLKRLSRRILFPLGELPFILIYQTMSSIYVFIKGKYILLTSSIISQFGLHIFCDSTLVEPQDSTENDMITIFVPQSFTGGNNRRRNCHFFKIQHRLVCRSNTELEFIFASPHDLNIQCPSSPQSQCHNFTINLIDNGVRNLLEQRLAEFSFGIWAAVVSSLGGLRWRSKQLHRLCSSLTQSPQNLLWIKRQPTCYQEISLRKNATAIHLQSRLGSHNVGINTSAPSESFSAINIDSRGETNKQELCLPDIETIRPKITNAIAGSFSRLNNECGSSLMKIKPGKI